MANKSNNRSRRDLINDQVQESESNISNRRSNKHPNYIQPGSKPINHFPYPSMYPFPMFGMGASIGGAAGPNMMMSGGIHNLIGNIKSLNI